MNVDFKKAAEGRSGLLNGRESVRLPTEGAKASTCSTKRSSKELTLEDPPALIWHGAALSENNGRGSNTGFASKEAA